MLRPFMLGFALSVLAASAGNAGTFQPPPAGDVHFQGPVANFAALPACWRDGDFRVTKDTYQAYVCAAGVWHAGGVGVPGSKIYNGSGVPGSGLGVSGDYYIRTATADLFAKSGSTWSIAVNLKGADGATGVAGAVGATGPQGSQGPQGTAGSTGTPGADGKTVRSGSGSPSSGLGSNGDFYLDTAAFAMYGPKTGGTWGSGTSLVGPAGPQGATGATGSAGSTGATGVTGAIGPAGPPGTTGANGSTWFSGTAAPSAGTGANGDYYFRSTTGEVSLKSAGTWSIIANLIGPIGPTGATGSTGATGTDGIPRTIQDEGADLTQRLKINFIGAGVACADNSGASRTDCAIPGSSGVAGPDTTVDRTVPAWNGTVGSALRASGVTIDASDTLTAPGAVVSPIVAEVGGEGYLVKMQAGKLIVANNGAIVFSNLGNLGGVTTGDTGLKRTDVAQLTCTDGGNGLCDFIVRSLRLTPRTTAPFTCSSGAEGAKYYNSTSHNECVCNGTAWVLSPGGSPGLTTGC